MTKRRKTQVSVQFEPKAFEEFNRLKEKYERDLGIKLARGEFIQILVKDVQNFNKNNDD